MLRTILRNIESIEYKTFLLLIIPILSGNIKGTRMFYWGGGKKNGSTPQCDAGQRNGVAEGVS